MEAKTTTDKKRVEALHKLGSLVRLVHDGGGGRGEAGLDACIVLNYTLPKDAEEFVNAAGTVIVCDGGANRLRAAHPSARVDVIIGDMDSAREDSIQHFVKQGQEAGRRVDVVRLPEDQESTDLEKALAHFYTLRPPSASDGVCACAHVCR